MTDLEALTRLVREAGAKALRYYGQVTPDEKADRSFVTAGDRAVEEFLRAGLEQHWPGIPVLGEELEDEVHQSVAWAVDPIDGTANFVAGVPIWAVCVGLITDGIPSMGCVYYPCFEEMYAAERHRGAWLNGQPIQVRKDGEIRRDDLLGLSTLAVKRMKVTLRCKVRSLGTAVSCYTFVAKGALIGGVVTDNRVWDIAAGLCIAWEAGAQACYLRTGELIERLPLTRNALPPQVVAPPQFLEFVRRGILEESP
ncbi:MAG: hypothetical protein NZ959_03580 [Armatimonadetes bacterium]|nr:hypothetical protein [Armatimonadota bacterium]MDW8121723.1 inositol monophosphatase family protein [Armatimonadota bacterium]